MMFRKLSALNVFSTLMAILGHIRIINQGVFVYQYDSLEKGKETNLH